MGLGDQGVYLAAHIGPVTFTDTGDADLFVERRLRRLRLAQDLLVELLPVPQAGVLDLHALRPAQLDHATRQVGDAHRLAHVEDEDLAALALRAGLKDQLAGLGNQHKVPYDVGVRHRHRAAGLDLALENRDHGAVGAEDVAEAGGDELGLPLHHAVALRLVEALHVDLAYSFAASHHVRRVHSLVGGHHHEAANAVFDRKVGQDLRAEDVVLDALARVVLHHRHVLVRRGVEDIFRKEGFEYVLHPVSLGDRRHHGGAWHRREVMRHHPADVVLRSLRGVDQHKGRRAERRHLAHYLAADASGGTGDQDALPTEGLGHGFQVDADLVTRQKILDADLLQGRRSLDRIMLGVNFVTGNTVIDALHAVVDKLTQNIDLADEQRRILKEAGYDSSRLNDGKKLVLITGHRRENFGEGFIHMVTAIRDLKNKYPEVDFVYPMHLNPNVRKPIHEVFGEDLSNLGNMFFIEPLQYLEFVYLMSKANIVLTDSGGIQEEAPGLGKPVLVMRDTTERPEALASGTVHLVGTDYDKIMAEVSTLLEDEEAYNKMSKAVNPYGDGKACDRIVRILNGENVDRYETI